MNSGQTNQQVKQRIKSVHSKEFGRPSIIIRNGKFDLSGNHDFILQVFCVMAEIICGQKCLENTIIYRSFICFLSVVARIKIFYKIVGTF